MTEELICTICPIGCHVIAEYDDDKLLSVRGNQCKRGPEYAEKEIFRPERMVTTTMRIHRAAVPLLPVRTAGAVAKSKTQDIVREISGRTATAPVRAGDVLIRDILGTRVDVVATRTLPRLW